MLKFFLRQIYDSIQQSLIAVGKRIFGILFSLKRDLIQTVGRDEWIVIIVITFSDKSKKRVTTSFCRQNLKL